MSRTRFLLQTPISVWQINSDAYLTPCFFSSFFSGIQILMQFVCISKMQSMIRCHTIISLISKVKLTQEAYRLLDWPNSFTKTKASYYRIAIKHCRMIFYGASAINMKSIIMNIKILVQFCQIDDHGTFKKCVIFFLLFTHPPQ